MSRTMPPFPGSKAWADAKAYEECIMSRPVVIELLEHGYISHTFGSGLATKQHLTRVLMRDTIFEPEPGEDFFKAFDRSHRCCYVLDYKVRRDIGTVIPQTLCTGVTYERQDVQHANLQKPIVVFLHTDGRLGLTLEAAINGRCDTLQNSQCPAPIGNQTTTYIRIGWRGYREFERQVQIRDETALRNTVTLSRFAQHVGQSVEAFLSTAHITMDSENQAPEWLIGQGGIQPNEIIIIGALQVSGSWMPIMQLNRHCEVESSVVLGPASSPEPAPQARPSKAKPSRAKAWLGKLKTLNK